MLSQTIFQRTSHISAMLRKWGQKNLIRYASNKSTVTMKRPSFNFKEMVSLIDKYKNSIARRQFNPIPLLDNLPDIFDKYKKLTHENNQLISSRRVLLNQMRLAEDKTTIRNELSTLKDTSKDLQEQITKLEEQLYEVCDALPNFIDESVPDSEPEVLGYLNTEELEALHLKPDSSLDHKKIGESLKILEFSQAAKVSGTSWYYLINGAALLEQALVQYALKLARENQFRMCIPPSIVKDEISSGCGFKPRDQNNEQQTYKLADSDLVLTGTAEIPLAGLGLSKTFNSKQLPRRMVGISRSYRAEAGARGKDTKGLYRVHEFTKVELFTWCEEESSEAEFSRIVKFQKQLIESLGLKARILNIPANDLGAPAFKKYDIEAWMPGKGTWGELTSTSICTNYQSTRFNTKYIDGHNKSKFAHTLNGTAMAIPRVIVAIIENFYNAEGNYIEVPEVLRTYMDGIERIEAHGADFDGW